MTLFKYRVRNGQDGRFWTLTGTPSKIVVPQNAGGDGAPRSPGGGQLGEFLVAWPLIKTLQPAHSRSKGQVTPGPDVGPPKRHQQVNVRGPRTNARNLYESCAYFRIRQLRQHAKIKCTGDYLPCKFVAISRFLLGDTGPVKARRGDRQKLARRDPANDLLQPFVRGPG